MDNVAGLDFSLVVNVHAGTKYLGRTMRSLEEAARYAKGYGIRTELVFVMDRSPDEAIAWVRGYKPDDFNGFQIVYVDNGSLGLSRNDGLLAARGGVVGFCDEDDLISYNTVSEFYHIIKSAGRDKIVLAEYSFAFSDISFLYRYYGSDRLSPLGFITGHPFTSHICVHKSIADRLRYSDVRLSPGYAYEDWHFNSEAIAAGYTFIAAPNTIIFYRKRSSGLLRSMDTLSTRQPPPSTLFHPPTYLRTCTQAYLEFRSAGQPHVARDRLVSDFYDNPLCLELTHAANRIDPAVDPVRAQHSPAGTNIDVGLRRGAAYYRACQLIGDSRFSDVILLPFLTRGGGEKYILNVLHGIAELEPNTRFLVLGGQRLHKHDWIEFLPERSTFIDLHSLGEGLNEEDIEALTLRLIESSAADARIHLKTSHYAHSFFSKYSKLIKGNQFIYYRFSDPVVEYDEQFFVRGSCFDFLSENSEQIDRILTDHHRIAVHDSTRLDPSGTKWRALYTRTDPLITAEAIRTRGDRFGHKLLWAARLDHEKRPELLLLIAEELETRLPDVSIAVFGQAVLNTFDLDRFAEYPNLTHYGSFESFGSLDHDAYDALVYTSAYDGLPNVVLEALSAGLPVIAPDLGGIGEAVIDGETGFLLPTEPDDAMLASSYVDAIASLYEGTTDYVRMRLNALDLIEAQHAPAAFLETLSETLKALEEGRADT